MTTWKSYVASPDQVSRLPAAIAEIHVLMYGLSPGQAEVQIRWPASAVAGTSAAVSVQAQMISAAVADIRTAAAQLGG